MELDIESRIFKETTQDFFLKISFPKYVLFPFLSRFFWMCSAAAFEKKGEEAVMLKAYDSG